MKIFGYGTFITSGIYKSYNNVRTAYLLGYIRIHKPTDPFPFILSNEFNPNTKGFWGLVFDVDQIGLEQLDYYEGSLYSRINATVQYSDKIKENVMVYYPTDQTISDYHLLDYVKEEDTWRIFIIERHPQILKEFPELGNTTAP